VEKDGEFHLWNPESIAALQDATRPTITLSTKIRADDKRPIGNPTTLRSLSSLRRRRKKTAGPIDESNP